MSTVKELAPLLEYQQSNAHLFPSIESIRWFIRNNKPELVNNNALLRIAGRDKVNPPAFDAVVIAVGKRAAQNKVAA